MATLKIESAELVLHLSGWERAGALHGDVRVPLSAVRQVRVSEKPWSELRGIRAPGTGIPRVLSVSTRRGPFGKDFAVVYGSRPVVVVELEGAEFSRLVVTCADPAEVAEQIRAAVSR